MHAVSWYWNQYKAWKPAKYNATDWIALMKRAGVTYFDFTTKHHEGFSMYDTSTRVHDCWDFDLSPGAKHVKGIKPCITSSTGPPPPPPCQGSACQYKTMDHTKCVATQCRFMAKTTLNAVKAACSSDTSCAGFDWFIDGDDGKPCAEGLKPGQGCGAMKRSCVSTATDKSNTAYIKQGFVPPPANNSGPDGIAFSSMEAFGRDITGELVAAARKGGIIPGL